MEISITKADNGYVVYVYNKNYDERLTKVFTELDETVDYIKEICS